MTKGSISKDHSIVPVDNLNLKKVTSYQIDKIDCIKNKYLLVISNKTVYILDCDTLTTQQDNLSPSEVEDYNYSLDVERNEC